MIISVHGDAGCLPHDPVVRERFWPGRIDLEFRCIGGFDRRDDQENERNQKAPHGDILPSSRRKSALLVIPLRFQVHRAACDAISQKM